MRAYFFGNMYLSSIQQGIQAAHVIGEMSVKYYAAMDGGDPNGEMFHEWAAYHKTIILLNAGYSENIHNLLHFFQGKNLEQLNKITNDNRNPYPFAHFCEGDDALDGAITCTGIILPEKIYDGAKIVKHLKCDTDEYMLYNKRNILELTNCGFPEEITYTTFEKELMERLNKFRSAI